MEAPESPNALWERRARAALDGKAKPPGSLGLLEEWAVKLSVLQRTLEPAVSFSRLLVFAGDHGVTAAAPGVSAYPRAVSAAVFRGIAGGGAASAALCASVGCTLEVVDVGLDADVSGVVAAPRAAGRVSVVHAKVAPGSADLRAGPALTPAQMAQAVAAGRAAVGRAALDCMQGGHAPAEMALAIGELGIGNTTSAAAVLAALAGVAPAEACGRGTGVDGAGLAAKQAAVAQALEANAGLVGAGPEGVLQAVGGLEVAAMVGAFLQAGGQGIPTIVDGFVSGAAALLACRIDPGVERCLFWSHRSEERGAVALLAAAGGRAALDMGLRLGEGTGAVLALPLLRSAAAVMRDMASLEEVMAAG